MNTAARHPSICIIHGGDHAKAAQWERCFSDTGWRTLMADLNQMQPEPDALPTHPPYIREAKLVFDFFQNINESFNAVLFTEAGTASYFCGKARKAMPAICNAALAVDMTDCLEWTLCKRKEPISDRGKLLTVELERACAELADIALMDQEQAQWLERKGWRLPETISSQESSRFEQFLRQFVETAPGAHAPEPPETTLISIVIPTYNRPELLRRAVDSALGQSWKHIELIIVDDGSTDPAAPPLLAQLETEPNIRVLRQENKHASAARNAGVRAARGEYVAFLDDDDTLKPDFLSTCLYVLTKTKADVCIPGMRVENASNTFFLGGGSSLMAQCVLENVFGAVSCLARRDTLLEHPFPETRAGTEEWAVYASMFLSGKHITCWPQALFQYRLTPVSLTAQGNAYADFRTRCLPLELQGKRDLALLSEMLAFQPESVNEETVRILMRRKLRATPIIGALLARCYDNKLRKKALEHAKIILKSDCFDAAWYVAHCPTSPKEELQAALHYLQEGWREGYHPSAAFDGNAYLARNLDVKNADMNPLLHYVQYGYKEGRRYT